MRNAPPIFVVVALGALALLPRPVSGEEPAKWTTVTERVLVEGVPLADGQPVPLCYVWHDADGYHLAWVDEGEYGDRLIVDGRPQRTWPAIRDMWGRRERRREAPYGGMRIFVSPNGRHIAHPVQTAAGQTIVVDGQADPFFDRIWPPVLNDEGDVSFAGSRGGSLFVCHRGTEYGPYPELCSPGGRQLYFDHATRMKGDQAAWIVREDGREGPQTLFVNGRAVDRASSIKQVRFLADGELLYLRHDAGEVRVVRSGLPGRPYERIDSYFVPLDGRCVGYSAQRKDGSWAYVIDDEEQPLRFRDGTGGADRLRKAYLGHEGGKTHLVVKGRIVATHAGIRGVRFSPDGKRLAYWATDDAASSDEKQQDTRSWFLMVDGKQGRRASKTTSIRFSPDGKRIAYYLQSGSTRILVVDGKELPWATAEWCSFSPDWRHVAERRWRGPKKRWIVDGVPGPAYDFIEDVWDAQASFKFLSPFVASDRLCYVAFRGGTAYLVEQR